jgi:hypothetical protein
MTDDELKDAQIMAAMTAVLLISEDLLDRLADQ